MNLNPLELDLGLMKRVETWAGGFEHANPKWNAYSLARVLYTMSFVAESFRVLWDGIVVFAYVTTVRALIWLVGLLLIDYWELLILRKINRRNPMRDASLYRLFMVVMATSMIFPLDSAWLTAIASLVLRIATVYLVFSNGMPPGWKPPEKTPAVKK